MPNSKSRNSAVLIFALSNAEEKKRKPFLENSSLISLLNDRVKDVVQSTGLDYFHFSENEQEGTNFGERFSNAIASIYAKGYNAVITIGNDSPGLKAAHILEAAKALDQKHFVLGPSIDGGFYLMGLYKEYFDKEKFLNFSWNTNKIGKEVRDYVCSFTNKFLQLNYLNDLDFFPDLKKVYTSLGVRLKKILLAITRIISNVSETFYNVELKVFDTLFKANYNKGSPHIFFL